MDSLVQATSAFSAATRCVHYTQLSSCSTCSESSTPSNATITCHTQCSEEHSYRPTVLPSCRRTCMISTRSCIRASRSASMTLQKSTTCCRHLVRSASPTKRASCASTSSSSMQSLMLSRRKDPKDCHSHTEDADLKCGSGKCLKC